MNVRQRLYIGNRKVVIFPVIRLQRTLNTVSYTHLDVYKRQVQNRRQLPGIKIRAKQILAAD